MGGGTPPQQHALERIELLETLLLLMLAGGFVLLIELGFLVLAVRRWRLRGGRGSGLDVVDRIRCTTCALDRRQRRRIRRAGDGQASGPPGERTRTRSGHIRWAAERSFSLPSGSPPPYPTECGQAPAACSAIGRACHHGPRPCRSVRRSHIAQGQRSGGYGDWCRILDLCRRRRRAG